MATYFTQASFKFLRGIARNNDRAWFQAHKADYDAHLKEPFQRAHSAASSVWGQLRAR